MYTVAEQSYKKMDDKIWAAWKCTCIEALRLHKLKTQITQLNLPLFTVFKLTLIDNYCLGATLQWDLLMANNCNYMVTLQNAQWNLVYRHQKRPYYSGVCIIIKQAYMGEKVAQV